MNGRKIDDTASCWLNSRHWVCETKIAFRITLTALAPINMTAHGVGEDTGAQGVMGTAAKAVSALISTKGWPHPMMAGVALTGKIEGAQKSKAATSTVLTILRGFIVAPTVAPREMFSRCYDAFLEQYRQCGLWDKSQDSPGRDGFVTTR